MAAWLLLPIVVSLTLAATAVPLESGPVYSIRTDELVEPFWARTWVVSETMAKSPELPPLRVQPVGVVLPNVWASQLSENVVVPVEPALPVVPAVPPVPAVPVVPPLPVVPAAPVVPLVSSA